MQNLQIQYGEFSAQLEYLEQYDLVQEEEIHRHAMNDFGEMSEGDLEFSQVNIEESNNGQSVSLTEFVRNIMRISEESEKKLIHRVIKVVLGDIFQHEYEHNHRIKMSPTTFFVRQKWSVLFHLLLFIVLIAYLSLEPLLLLALTLWFLTLEENEDSQLQIEESFKRTYNNLSSQIKRIYLDKSTYSKRSIDRLTYDLERIVRYLKAEHCFDLTDSPFIIDQLNQCFHILLQALTNRSFSKIYLESHSIFKKKYFYWRLKLENRKLSKLVNVITAILNTFSENKWIQPAKQVKPKTEQTVYYKLLISKLQKQYHSIQQGKTCYHLYRQLLCLLIKEVEFKRVLRLHQQKYNHPQEKTPEQSYQQVPVFHQEERPLNDSYYFETDQPIPYEPQNTESIKQRLNQLFSKKHEKSEKSQPQEIPKETTFQKMVQKPQRSIFSFGIPLAPPPRDLSAFYYE